MARTLRLAIVADIHHGRSLGTKKGHAALSLLTSVRDRIDPLGLDLIVDLGDRINNIDHKTDLGLMRDVADVFDTFGTPRAHLLGNHDNDALTRQDVERVMGVPFTSHSLNLSGYHLVFWNANTHLRAEHGFSFAPGDLDWLREDIASTTLPTIVFSHVPLDNGSMIGNYYFENYFSNSAHYDQGHLARDIIERSGRVVLCVSGHTHWNARNTIDGVHYVTVQSLTESFTTWPEPAEAWGLLTIDDNINLEVFGRDQILHRLPIRNPDRHWVNLDRPFAPKPDDLSPLMKRRIEEKRAKLRGAV